MANISALPSDMCFAQLKGRHEREYPDLSKAPNTIHTLTKKWGRKLELLNNPEIRKQLKLEALDQHKQEVRNETAKMEALKQQAVNLLDALKAGTSTVSKKIDTVSDWKPKNYDHHLYALGNLQSKRDAMQILCKSMTAEMRHANAIGQQILAVEALPPSLTDDRKGPIEEPEIEPIGLEGEDSWEYLEISGESSGSKDKDSWEYLDTNGDSSRLKDNDV
jgi:hypothetical protein